MTCRSAWGMTAASWSMTSPNSGGLSSPLSSSVGADTAWTSVAREYGKDQLLRGSQFHGHLHGVIQDFRLDRYWTLVEHPLADDAIDEVAHPCFQLPLLAQAPGWRPDIGQECGEHRLPFWRVVQP